MAHHFYIGFGAFFLVKSFLFSLILCIVFGVHVFMSYNFVFGILYEHALVEMSCNDHFNGTCVNDVACVSLLVIHDVDLCFA